MRRSWILSLVLASPLVVLTCASTVAHAGDLPSAAGSAEVDRLFAEGQRAFDAGRFEEAERAFERAWEKKRTYDVAANLGFVELKLGKHAEAASHLAYAVENSPPSDRAAARKAITDALAEARQGSASLRVRVNVKAAQLFVDEVPVPGDLSAREIFVKPGRHTIRAVHPGTRGDSKVIEVAKGQAANVELHLEAEGTSAPVVGEKSTVPTIVGGAVAAGLLGVGVGFTLAANSSASTAAEQSRALGATRCASKPAEASPCGEIKATAERWDTYESVAIAGFAAAGAVALGTAGYALFWPKPSASTRHEAARLRAAPSAAPGYLGARAWMTF